MSTLGAVDTAYAVFASVLAIVFWAALVLLVMASKRHNHWLKRFGLMVVVLVAALFWSTAAVMRITGTTDPVVLNMWSRILYAMLAFYVLGFAWLNWSIPRGQS